MKILISKSKWERLKVAQFSGYDELTLGSTPSGEQCAQVGSPNYDVFKLSRIEIRAFINQLKRLFPNIPDGVMYKIKSNPHDFGTYYEAAIKFKEDDKAAVEYVYNVDENAPEFWDDIAKQELENQGYFAELAKDKKDKKPNKNDNDTLLLDKDKPPYWDTKSKFSKGKNMKIKVSKSQWKMIGNKTGWIKQAQDINQIKVLIGKTLTNVSINDAKNEIIFVTNMGEKYILYHDQDDSENVTVEDINGELSDLENSPILMAEEVTQKNKLTEMENENDDDSFTWTFYKFATIKGYVTIRWYGGSNGYYSESVSFKKIN